MNVYAQDHDGPAMGCRERDSALQDDGGASPRETGPSARGAARVAPPKKPAAPTPVPRSSMERMSPTASGGRADRAGKVLPRRAPGKGRRQGQHDATHRTLDPHRELEQPLPQRGDLGVGAGRAPPPALELLEQDVGGERQQGPEPGGPASGA